MEPTPGGGRMEPVCHIGVQAVERLRTLDLTPSDLYEPLKGAAAEARLSTQLDAPGMAGFTFWSRANRFFRERLQRQGWTYSNAQNILRTFHPSGLMAITAISGAGKVMDENASWSGEVRAKNPKGSAIRQLVQRNFEQLPLFEIPTWFLLYKSTESGLLFELSLPVDMHDDYVDTWRERIILTDNPLTGPKYDIKKLDEAPAEKAVVVPVQFKGVM
ncbi:hypothetical protein ACFXI6_21980 [Streptomyces mirabilis]|uniref:hypothetical protein n=1 Tax=Streptomyces mirabilis TaxID=68239 RepID=UPI0036BC77FA